MRACARRYGHAFFSALAPGEQRQQREGVGASRVSAGAGTHVAAHTGPTNKKLRVHVPLVVRRAAPGPPGLRYHA